MFPKWDGFIGITMFLVLVGLLLKDANATTSIFSGLANSYSTVLKTLQGR